MEMADKVKAWEQARNDVNKLLNGFDKLPGLYQVIGALQERLHRCKLDSKLYKDTWNKLTKLENEVADISSSIRLNIFTRLYSKLFKL
jgi:conjugal transfer/entry exclusion protein